MSENLEKDGTSSTQRGEVKIEGTMTGEVALEEGWTGVESQGQDHQWALEEAEALEVVVVHRWVALGVVQISVGEIDSHLKEAGGMRCLHLPSG